jgi:hypothetical protein
MPARHGTDPFAPGIALRDNRSLHFRRPIPPLARTREHLDPLRPPAHRIITRDYHSSSALPPYQGTETRRCASGPQGGMGTALTVNWRLGALITASNAGASAFGGAPRPTAWQLAPPCFAEARPRCSDRETLVAGRRASKCHQRREDAKMSSKNSSKRHECGLLRPISAGQTAPSAEALGGSSLGA